MAIPRNPGHDQNFKNLLVDYPHDALMLFAPEEAEGVVPSVRITPVRQEQLKARLGDRFRELDVPLLVEWPDGQREALLFVLEEETDPRRFSIHRLAHYCLDLAEMFKLERVVSVVIFLSSMDEIPDHLALGSERRLYLQFNYLKCILSKLNSVDYWDSTNLVARLNLPSMRHEKGRKVAVYAQAIKGLLTLEPDPAKQAKYLDFVDIYSALDDNEMQHYIAQYPQEAKAMTTLSERLREEGMQQGMHVGVEAMLRKQIALKFGPMPNWADQQIASASDAQLDEWVTRILTVGSLNELLGKSQ